MIEKLKPLEGLQHNWLDKINALVDAINNQQIQLNNHECRLLDLHNRISALDDPTYHEEPADPYAEQQEEWKDIKGYENLYQVSNLGNIRRVSNKIKKTRLNNWGYIIIDLWKENKSTTKAVHRIVAETFLPNPDNKAEVNHIDGNKTNNSINNLEWVTREENIQHAYDTGLNPKSLPMPEVVKMPKIICCETGDVFNSITEASHKYNISISHLSSCLNGKDNRKTLGGWHWLYCYCQPVSPDDDIIFKGE